MRHFLAPQTNTRPTTAPTDLVTAPSSVDTLNTTLTERCILYGHWSVYIWTGEDCSGTDFANFHDFGCGGQCHVITGPGDIRTAMSANLYRDTTALFYPTMDVFSDTNCQDYVSHFEGESWEYCSSTSTPFRSFYLYYGCNQPC
jgi:hypothetical protein